MSILARQRRNLLRAAALPVAFAARRLAAFDAVPPKRVAALATTYFHNSHADVIVSRLLQGYSLLGEGERPNLELAGLYVDQIKDSDLSRGFSQRYGFGLYDSIGKALCLGGDRLAVDGVLLVAEHGDYPVSTIGSIVYPKRRFFEELLRVFDASGRVAPVFVDKHLADNWDDAKWLYDEAVKRKIPLMAGSSVPQTWRRPPADVPRGAELRELLVLSFHTLDAYGFHAVEALQALAERRKGGETGVRAVQCLTGGAAWRELDDGRADPKLLDAALERLERPPADKSNWRQNVSEPVLFRVEYADGVIGRVLTLNGVVGEWTAAWRDATGRIDSTLFWTQEARPLGHFTHLVQGIDRMFQTGRPSWPVERTLLTSGALALLLESKARGYVRRETPELDIRYESDWDWQDPPPPPPSRALDQQ